MILGIGTDLCDIGRIEKSLERFGERFVQAHLHRVEQKRSEGRRDPGGELRQALRRQGGLRQGARHRPAPRRLLADMGVVNLRGGKPTMALTGGAMARLEEITPAGMSPQFDLTLTDEYPLAQAIVIISAVPAPMSRDMRDRGSPHFAVLPCRGGSGRQQLWALL